MTEQTDPSRLLQEGSSGFSVGRCSILVVLVVLVVVVVVVVEWIYCHECGRTNEDRGFKLPPGVVLSITF